MFAEKYVEVLNFHTTYLKLEVEIKHNKTSGTIEFRTTTQISGKTNRDCRYKTLCIKNKISSWSLLKT